MVSESAEGDGNPSTPRGEAELLDFDELERVEQERAGEQPGGVGALCVQEETPFQELRAVRVGNRVQVLSNAVAVLRACRETGIDATHDGQRMEALGREASVLSKDPSDNTVRCDVPGVGPLWFGVHALAPAGGKAAKSRHAEELESDEDPGKAAANEQMAVWAEAWWARVGQQEDGELGAGAFGGEHDGEAIMRELELEACIERRLWEGLREGRLGALITVKDPDGAEANGRTKRGFICDVMNTVVTKLNKLFVNKEQVVSAGAQRLEYFVFAVVALLSFALPCRFANGAAIYFERLVRLFQDRRSGLCQLVRELLTGELPQAQQAYVWRRVDGVLRDAVSTLRHLLDCIVGNHPEERERLEAAYAEAALLASAGTDSLQEELLAGCTCATHHSGGKNHIVRTSVVTITQLLYELRAGFQSEAFQGRYRELREQARYGGEAHVRMVEWTFDVQQKVLVRYGFEASPRGVWSMRAETGYHADGFGGHMRGSNDEAVSKLRRDIHVLLEMESQKNVRLPVFHTVGDSHSKFGWPPCVIQHWQGPLLCHNVDRVDLRKMQPPIHEGDAICLCFGEIDCRCHVHKHVTEEKTYQVVIDGIIEKYFNHLRSQVRLLPQGVRIFLYNVLPPVRKSNAELNTEFPYLGEDEERLAYVRYFNQRLKQECQHASFRFFDVYDRYADEEGFLSEEYSDGSVHVSDGVWIDEVIKSLKLKPIWVSELNFGV